MCGGEGGVRRLTKRIISAGTKRPISTQRARSPSVALVPKSFAMRGAQSQSPMAQAKGIKRARSPCNACVCAFVSMVTVMPVFNSNLCGFVTVNVVPLCEQSEVHDIHASSESGATVMFLFSIEMMVQISFTICAP